MEWLEGFIESITVPMSYEFMQRALIGCVLVGLICAVIGVFVVLQNLAFIGQGVAQGALPGLALGFALGTSLYVSALICTIVLALAIAFLREHGRLSGDTAIAIAFSIAAALGVALIAAVRFGQIDVNSYLFGNVIAIRPEDLRILVVAVVVLLGIMALLFRDLTFAVFDPEGAGAAGLPVRMFSYLFLVMVAVAVVISLQTVGLLLVTALLVIPAATARLWCSRLPSMFVVASCIGVSGGMVGLYLSYHLRYPSGAMIVLAVGAVFLASLGLRALSEWKGRRLSQA